MRIIKSIKDMTDYIRKIKRSGDRSIGFVPTMGYLHKGHISLIKRADKDTDVVVVSIFVNPMQFGPSEDYRRYPRDLSRDATLAKSAGCDIIFNPKVSNMYPSDFDTYVEAEKLSRGLCGRFRPGHFRGVATVVAKLFNIVKPDIAYFGQKDYQQAVIIKRIVEDLNIDIKIKVLPTVRERDGLAASSRNIYLSSSERKDAIILYQALKYAKGLISKGERHANKIIQAVRSLVAGKVSKIDYVSVVDAYTLKEKDILSGRTAVMIVAWLGKTRLIDNMIVKVRE